MAGWYWMMKVIILHRWAHLLKTDFILKEAQTIPEENTDPVLESSLEGMKQPLFVKVQRWILC